MFQSIKRRIVRQTDTRELVYLPDRREANTASLNQKQASYGRQDNIRLESCV
jgi:hypothetical protein